MIMHTTPTYTSMFHSIGRYLDFGMNRKKILATVLLHVLAVIVLVSYIRQRLEVTSLAVDGEEDEVGM